MYWDETENENNHKEHQRNGARQRAMKKRLKNGFIVISAWHKNKVKHLLLLNEFKTRKTMTDRVYRTNISQKATQTFILLKTNTMQTNVAGVEERRIIIDIRIHFNNAGSDDDAVLMKHS